MASWKSCSGIVALAMAIGLSGCFHRNRAAGPIELAAAIPPPNAVQTVASYSSLTSAPFPRIAAGPAGDLQLAWMASAGGAVELMTRRLVKAEWSPAAPGARTTFPALLTDAGVDPQGRLHVLYLSRVGRQPQVFHRVQTAQGWSPPEQLSEGRLPAYAPRLAIDGQGKLHTAWYVVEEHNAGVFYRQWDGTGWQAVEQVAMPDAEATFWAPSLAVAPDGTVHIAYFSLTAHGSAVLYTHRTSGKFLAGTILSEGQKFATAPTISIDGGGVPHVVWIGGERNEILYYTNREGGHWSLPATIAARPHAPRNPALAVDGRGIVHVAWSEQTDDGRQQIFLARGRNEHWAQPVNVSRSAGDADAVTATITGETLHLTWAEGAGPDDTQIRWLPLDLRDRARGGI